MREAGSCDDLGCFLTMEIQQDGLKNEDGETTRKKERRKERGKWEKTQVLSKMGG